jgi:hypothetical protein
MGITGSVGVLQAVELPAPALLQVKVKQNMDETQC